MKMWHGKHINLLCEQFWSRSCDRRFA